MCLIKKNGKTNKHRHYFTFCKTQFHYKIGPFIWNSALMFAISSLEKWQLVPWEINTVALLGSLFHLYQGTAVDLAARVVAFNCDWLYWAGRGFCTCIILKVDLYLPNFSFNGQFFLFTQSHLILAEFSFRWAAELDPLHIKPNTESSGSLFSSLHKFILITLCFHYTSTRAEV